MVKVLRNGRFLHPSGHNPKEAVFANCLVLDESSGKILYVGSDDGGEVQSAMSSGAEMLDMQNRLVVPGFIDSHMHLLHTGQTLNKLDISGCETLEEIRTAIRNYAKAHPDMDRILCCSWFQTSTNGEAFASQIDDLDPRPIYIYAYDMHSMWCNTAALSELQVADLEDPPGGKIHRDEAGKPTGLLSETAALSIADPFLSAQLSSEQKLGFIHDAIDSYIASGYTGLIDMAMDEKTWDIILSYRKKCGGNLPIWMAVHWFVLPQKTPEETLAQVDEAITLNKQYNEKTSPDCRITGIKIMCDGVVDACTASLMEPYSHNGGNEPAVWTVEELVPILKKADDAGLQIAIHAIGDAAIRIAIDSLEQVGNPQGRHRIEHLETCSPEDVKRLGKLGITASVQPVHSDPSILQAWPKLLGPKRCEHVFPYNGFAEHGATVAIGTDAPTASHLVLPNLYTATTRRSGRKPELDEQTAPRFALSLAAAMAAATQGAAYSCFADDRVGRLEPGKAANLAVVDVVWDPARLLEGKVQETWYQGRKIYG
ncbi:amidohydrolase family protein [Metarhizium anisopliae]